MWKKNYATLLSQVLFPNVIYSSRVWGAPTDTKEVFTMQWRRRWLYIYDSWILLRYIHIIQEREKSEGYANNKIIIINRSTRRQYCPKSGGWRVINMTRLVHQQHSLVSPSETKRCGFSTILNARRLYYNMYYILYKY